VLATLRLVPVTGTSGENAEFFASTPSGQVELGVVAEGIAERFELGKSYYLDFNEAPSA